MVNSGTFIWLSRFRTMAMDFGRESPAIFVMFQKKEEKKKKSTRNGHIWEWTWYTILGMNLFKDSVFRSGRGTVVEFLYYYNLQTLTPN